MGTKNNPGSFDCYTNAAPDEPMFVLLGRDKHAPILVELWTKQRADEGEDPAKVEEALKCAKAMRRWRHENKRTSECEYCQHNGADNCKIAPSHIVTEDGFVHWYWCGNYDGYLHEEAGVQTIDEYFSTEEVSNSYIDDAGDECEACDQL